MSHLVLEQLRGHVVRGANLRASKRHGAVHHFGDAEITEDKAAVPKQEDVLGFDVAMQHLATVHVVDAEGNLQLAAVVTSA